MDLSAYALDTLRQDSEFTLYRGRPIAGRTSDPPSILVYTPTSEHPHPNQISMLEREFDLRAELNSTWAVRPLALVRHHSRTALVLEDPQGEPLDQVLETLQHVPGLDGRRPAKRMIGIGLFLRLAVGIAAALGEVHQRGIIHKNVKPAHVLVNIATGQVWLTGFGIASRLLRERQTPAPPETIAGTLAYMAPEQTGRMNRSIDSRSDLYALGVTLYETLTGSLPFIADDPIEWVHCHVARQATPPHERVKHVPAPMSAIIMKLLAKTAEERYQTAAGLQHDLERCLLQFESEDQIDDFELGQSDRPRRLLIPETLYGRQREIELLLAAFARIGEGAAPELVLVSGYAGIGKSTVVNELHKVLVPRRGLFAAGKFDQYKRDVPYSSLAGALQNLVLPLLAGTDSELNRWRDAFREALGPNGQLIVDLVPTLKAIIGEQVPVPELPPQEERRRFQHVFRRFIEVLARPHHPLVLFLDDLQWLDAATLDLIEDLLMHRDLRHFLLIGAYRDNEVDSTHPLMHTVDRIRIAGVAVQEILLGTLPRDDACQLVADSLGCNRESAAPLADMVLEKTGGNPFFVIQFLAALVEGGLLTFDQDSARPYWDLARIHAKGYTDNIVDLMVDRLSRLPIRTQKLLQRLACLGHSAELPLLMTVSQDLEGEVQYELEQALRTELIIRSDGAYRFLHDRVQEAAYSLIPRAECAEVHLRIGRLLVAHTPAERREEAIFEIVNQLNRGARLISSQNEREQLAAFNLVAGKRAKAASAPMAALGYLSAGESLLGKNKWQRNYGLAFELELHLAECQYLVGRLAEAERRLASLSRRAQSVLDSAAVVYLRLNLYMVMDRSDDAVAVGLAYLRRHQSKWRLRPTAEDVKEECGRLWRQIEASSIESLLELPLMSDPEQLATMKVFTALVAAAQFTDLNLFHLVIIRMVALSLEHGNAEGSCQAYAVFGCVPSPDPEQAQAGFRIGRIALDLVEKHKFDGIRGVVYYAFALFTAHWTQPLATCQGLFQRAFDATRAVGDLATASYTRVDLVTNLLATGEPLDAVERAANGALAFVQSVGFGLIGDVITAQLRLIRTLRGLTSDLNSFDDEVFREHTFEQHLESDSRLAIAASRYWIRKLQAKVYAGDYAAAVVAASKAASLLWTLPAQQELPEYHFYAALAWAGHCDAAGAEQRRHRALQELSFHHQRIVRWSKSGPENFVHEAALLGAELARLEGREKEAMHLYEEAVRSAGEQDFTNIEGLANELAGRFWSAEGFTTIAQAYLRNARYCYLRWGADGKVRQLDRLYPDLKPEQAMPDLSSTITAPLEHLDLATVIEVSQAVSGEMVPEKLIDRLMRSAIEHAGAERGILISPQGEHLRVDAEATAHGQTVAVHVPGNHPGSAVALPESLIRYTMRAGETVILGDALSGTPFSTDPYILQRRARSVLCLPLINQGKLIGVLYLENTLMPHAFVPERVTVLKVLASQAAISLENTRLYHDLAEREARIRRLVDANIIGIFIWDLDGRILDANDALLTMVRYDRQDVLAGRLLWTDLIPPEWRARDEQLLSALKIRGTLQPFESEYLRKDGTRVPVLIGVAAFEGASHQGVAYVLDLTERKRAQDAISRAGAELAHVSRVAALGAVTASITHEINQPLAGIMTNAGTCLRMLDRTPPDIDGARETARRTIRDGNRASEVITRVRALFSKREFTVGPLDLNETAREIIALSSSDLRRNRVTLRSEFADNLPNVTGDRIQLQQVILNMVRNATDAMTQIEDSPRQLVIKTERTDDGYVTLAVRDTGVGLPPQGFAQLFDAFYTTKSTGMGIGLFISRSIVERHNGRLWAEPNAPGPGATFSFSIPGDAQLAPPNSLRSSQPSDSKSLPSDL